MTLDKTQFVIPNDVGICLLECKQAFEALTPQEKLYAHYLSKASFYGSLVCLYQCSPESPAIFLLLHKLFRSQTVDKLKSLALSSELTDDEFQAVLVYTAAFFANMGNYKSFGDSKFVPNLDKEKFEVLVKHIGDKQLHELWDSVSDRLYNLEPKQRQLGLGESGTTSYFSANCSMKDAELAQEFLTSKKIGPYNTRLFKYEKDGKVSYEVRIASSNITDCGSGDMGILGNHEFTPIGSQPIQFTVTRGDYGPVMSHVVENLKNAMKFVSNDLETKMLNKYIESFSEGSLAAHKDGSRFWIKNKGPIIETYIGFIESYRDPYGVRGEFEGFVSMVNKEMSAKFENLVKHAEHFLPHLPWPSAYEKDEFLRPDFTSLDVLTFGSSGIPAGINIPNYDDIRQTDGFKNVSLGNVICAAYKETKINFLKDEDKELYTSLKVPSFEVQVGLHELLGHGSGKLFIKESDGSFNFDTEHIKHTETGETIGSWYESEETWDTKFQTLSSAYEECRAECVGIYLCLLSDVLKIFGHTGNEADDLIYINWLNMVRAGLLALEFYSPETNKWRQAHMHARYVILRVLLEAGSDLVQITQFTGDDGNPDITISLDRSKINTVGKTAIGNFLRKLQVYKSTADYKQGKAMFDKYSAVNDDKPHHFSTLRNIVIARKQPRKLFVQCNTTVEGDDVKLVPYESSAEGLIQSNIDRFSAQVIDDNILQLWIKDAPHF